MLWFELFLGLALLLAGGESLVRGASALASRLGVSSLLIGLTVVGFGTSTPELVTSLQAALAGSPGIAVGNVVGSNIANILLILGLAATMMPFAVERRAFLRDGPVLLLATLACVAIALWGDLSRFSGFMLVAGLLAYLVFAYRSETGPEAATEPAETHATTDAPVMSAVVASVWAAAGMILTVLGARLLVGASIDLATLWGISETVIGLTIIAVGTSLPELVTSAVAAVRRQGAIAFGNVVGSNLYNILGILGITALSQPIPVPQQIADIDVWLMLAATLGLFVVVMTGWRVSRPKGAALLAAYAGYVGWLATGL